MGKFFGKGTNIDTIFNLKEGVTSASSLNDYDFSTIKEEVKSNLDPEPIIFISDPNYGNFIWANGLLFGSITDLKVSGRNLAIRKTLTLENTSYYSLNEYKQNTADTAGNVFKLLISTLNSLSDLTPAQLLVERRITSAGVYSFTVKLNDRTLYIRIKHNGDTTDGPDLRYTLPYIVPAGTHITISLNIVSVTNSNKIIGNIKIEEGKVATAFTMAPEDILVGGANLLQDAWADSITGYYGTTFTKSSISSTINEFNKSASDDPAILITTSGGTSTSKIYLIATTLYKAERDLIYSIWIKNLGSTPIRVQANGIEGTRDLKTVNAGEAKKLIFVQRLPNTNTVRFWFKTNAVEDSIDCIIWHPSVQEGNVPTEYIPNNTRVIQTPTSSNIAYNLLTTTTVRSSSAVTDTTCFSTKLTYNPSTSTLKNNACSQVYDSTNECLKFVFN